RIASRRFDDLLDGLCGTVSVDALLAAFAAPDGAGPDGAGPVTDMRGAIDRHFAGDTVEDILAALESGGEAARAMGAAIRGKAPLSLKLALAQLRRGRDWDFDACMRAEFRIVSRVVREKDFYEGVRAVIVDKDNAPRWSPAALSEVGSADVERHFAPLERELVLP
ncbi:MAG TPA: enoyl-CoA hydratase/isomerase family protein, partial [Xanthobacteraceae bacterium]|nr:enoyl-CoA hydratase/isomerase family protein [Xanthobacteraceae bacterium]